jgi:hypothetical protein
LRRVPRYLDCVPCSMVCKTSGWVISGCVPCWRGRHKRWRRVRKRRRSIKIVVSGRSYYVVSYQAVLWSNIIYSTLSISRRVYDWQDY